MMGPSMFIAINAEMSCGTRYNANALPNVFAAAMMINIAVVVTALSFTASQKAGQVRRRNQNVVIKIAVTNPTAEASVGVNAPE